MLPMKSNGQKLLTIGDSKYGPCGLSNEDVSQHIHILGPTGCGKSELMFAMFKQACPRNIPIVLWDNKGGLAERCKDWAVTSGYGSRVNYMDLGSPDCPGLDTSTSDDLELSIQVEAERDGILMGGANYDFAMVPQMQRMLYMGLYLARAANMDIEVALQALYPNSPERLELLRYVDDPFMIRAIETIDELSQRRREDLLIPALARIENFLNYRPVRRILTSRTGINVKEGIKNNRILIVKAAINQPTPKNKVQMLGRLFTQHLLYSVFSLYPDHINEKHPCMFFCDEVQHVSTPLLADFLDMARVAMSCIFAHQHLHQLKDEDKSGYLYHSVMQNMRTKIIFGGIMDPEELKLLAQMMFFDTFDAHKIKDEQWVPHNVPLLRWIEQKTYTTSESQGESMQYPSSTSKGTNTTRGTSEMRGITYSRGTNESHGITETHGTNESEGVTDSKTQSATLGATASETTGTVKTETDGSSSTDSWSDSYGESESEGSSSNTAEKLLTVEGIVIDETVVLPVVTASEGDHSGTGSSNSHNFGSSRSDIRADSRSQVETETNGVTITSGRSMQKGTSKQSGTTDSTGVTVQNGTSTQESSSLQFGTSTQHGRSMSTTTGETPGWSRSRTYGESTTMVPFYEQKTIWIPNRTYYTPEEQLNEWMILLNVPVQGSFWARKPYTKACYMRAQWNRPLRRLPSDIAKGMARMLQHPADELPMLNPKPADEPINFWTYEAHE